MYFAHILLSVDLLMARLQVELPTPSLHTTHGEWARTDDIKRPSDTVHTTTPTPPRQHQQQRQRNTKRPRQHQHKRRHQFSTKWPRQQGKRQCLTATSAPAPTPNGRVPPFQRSSKCVHALVCTSIIFPTNYQCTRAIMIANV
jgi:hypothetical protein